MALELRKAGWARARALTGGWRAWLDQGQPVEPRTEETPAALDTRPL